MKKARDFTVEALGQCMFWLGSAAKNMSNNDKGTALEEFELAKEHLTKAIETYKDE